MPLGAKPAEIFQAGNRNPRECYHKSMKTALITGASRGLGKAVAKALAGDGYAVGINYLRSEKEARALAEELGNGAILLRADVGNAEDVRLMMEEVKSRWGRLDALINNAGISKDSLLIKTSVSDWDETMRVNLKSAFNTIRAFAPLMRDSGGGHIVNIISYSGLRGKEGQSAYSASKAGLSGLTVTAARELGQWGIKVNAVAPGYMPTDMGGASPLALKEAKALSVLNRVSTPEEAAGFIMMLVRTSGITGQTFVLDSRI